MVQIPLCCPKCDEDQVVKYGKTENGTQRYLCVNKQCDAQTFITNFSYNGCKPGISEEILDLTMNASGIRDTARVLHISPGKVIRSLKSFEAPKRVNKKLLSELKDPKNTEVEVILVEEAEADEMWSFVQKKENQRWLWWAIDHNTGHVLAFTFGERKDKVFIELKEMLEPFGIMHFYTDDWGSYSRNLPSSKHSTGKNKTWKIERKHLNLRTRIKRLTRKTVCFSKSVFMHDHVIGLFINRFEWSLI